MGSLYLLLYVILYCYIFILYGEFKRKMCITLGFNLTLPKKERKKKNMTTKLHTQITHWVLLKCRRLKLEACPASNIAYVYFKASVSTFCVQTS